MKISVIIPSRWMIEVFGNILHCLEKQTFKDFEVILVLDKKFENKSDFDIWENAVKEEYKRLNLNIICNINHKSDWKENNASFLRNIWIKESKWELINIFDDDIVFDENYLLNSLRYLWKFENKYGRKFVICPTMMYRDTNLVQSQWFSSFDFWQCRPIACELGYLEYDKIEMFSGNSIFGCAEIFRETLFDEVFDFVNEDLDFTYRISMKHDIFVLRDLIVHHMERDKTILENLRIWSAYQAYKRAKHRILFVRKNWTFWQKLIAYSVWLTWNNLWMIRRIWKYGKSPEKFNILRAYLKWIWDWVWFKF